MADKEKHQCSGRVWSQGSDFRDSCSAKGVLFENDKWWCRRHAPSKWERKSAISDAHWKIVSLKERALELCIAIHLDIHDGTISSEHEKEIHSIYWEHNEAQVQLKKLTNEDGR